MINPNIDSLSWSKVNGLIPAVIQHAKTREVLMLGYMNKQALEQTIQTKKVTFYSRTKQRLWTKGETSGNFLALVEWCIDCDMDALLILVTPQSNCCHLDSPSCFNLQNKNVLSILLDLENLILNRYNTMPDNSYTTHLFSQGIKRIAQKVGEEGVEIALAAVSNNVEELKNETADFLYHLLVLLRSHHIDFSEALGELQKRFLP